MNKDSKVTLSVPEVMERTGLCRNAIYAEINSGRLRSFKVGSRRLITPAALDTWVNKQEQAERAA